MSQNPTINTIIYRTPAAGSVSIINQTVALTVNVQDNTNAGQNLTVGAKGPASGINDSLTVIQGNAVNNKGDVLGLITVTGDELFTLRGDGGPRVTDDNVGVLLTPTAGGNEQVTISGNTTLRMGLISNQAAIADLLPTGSLNLNNMTVKVTNTAATEFFDGQVAPMFFRTDTAGKAPFIGYSTNAATIDASTSGGLIMIGGDANFLAATTVAGGLGDTIVGAANPVGLSIGGVTIGDILGGSIGNDTITSKSLTLPDYIFTNGGADRISLAAGHTGADHVAFYAGEDVRVSSGALAVRSVESAISEGFLGGDFFNPGWFGIAPGGAATNAPASASAHQSTLTGFVPDQDILDFSVKAWGIGIGVGVAGLSADNGTVISNVTTGFVGLSSDTGTPVNAVQVSNGGTMKGTTGSPADFFIFSSGTFLNAIAVASALQTGTYVVNHSQDVGEMWYDVLIAYQGLDGNAHIADLHWIGVGTTTLKTDLFVSVSDIVTLVGVNIPQLAANTSHIHLVT